MCHFSKACCSIFESALAVVIVAGAAMVAQPSFIFGSSDSSRGEGYLVGALLAILVAAMVAVFNVLSAKYREVPTGVFLTIGGARYGLYQVSK